MFTKLNINQILERLFKTMMTYRKEIKINYEYQFKINKILKDKIA
jgi:hypothetical protein